MSSNVLRDVFSSISPTDPDQIFELTARYQAELERFKKGVVQTKPYNLGVGKFINEAGDTPLMKSVVSAVREVLAERETNVIAGGYLPILGDPKYRSGVENHVFGSELADSLRSEERLLSCQTLGGTEANFVQGSFLNKIGVREIALSNPTWGNHKKIFPFAGVNITSYPYYCFKSSQILFAEMLQSVKGMDSGTAVSFHACCHNPTGADLSESQWQEVLALVKERDLVAVFDAAYVGFARSVEEDLFAIREAVQIGIPSLVAFSFSKVASLYEERLGACLVVLPKDYAELDRVKGVLEGVQRPSISNPPALFARAMGRVLHQDSLRNEWLQELALDASEIRRGGQLLEDELEKLGVSHGGIGTRNGMFAILPFSPEQVASIEREESIFMMSDGRINVAAIKESNAKEIADRMARIVG